MKARITNKSGANQGIWTETGLETIEPGKTRTLTIAEDHIARTKRLSFLKVEDASVASMDHDDDGNRGGMKSPSGEVARPDEIQAAVQLLDKDNDDHWTAAGLPAVEAVTSITGKTVTRAAINEAAPDAKRPA